MYPFQNPELPLETRVNDLVSRLTLEEKINLMCQYQDDVPRLGIRKYKHGTEAAHGIAWLGEATVFPQPVGLACTWDAELLRRVGDVIGKEARGFYRRNPELHGLTLWAPTVDMERDPRWGRTEEAYGEDPFLAGKLAAALVRGIQGDHPFYLQAVATLKHFLGNNNERDRGSCSVSIDPRNMREYYLNVFERVFREGGAQSMMTAYNAVNGVPANLNPDVLDMVKREWGMNGFVVSDAGDVLGTVNDHKFFSEYKEAVAASIRSGIDSITDDHDVSKQAIRDALAAGLLTENDLDTALRNAFRVRFRLGEFDPEERNPYAAIPESVICAPEHREVAREAARKNVVLLKNANGALPLDAGNIRRLAVIGPLADVVYRDWYSGSLPYAITPLDGIRARLPEGAVVHASGRNRVRLRHAATGRYVRLAEDGAAAGTPADGERVAGVTEANAPAGTDTAGEAANAAGAAAANPRPASGLLVADEPAAERAAVLEVTDWGWGSHTLFVPDRGRYVTTDDVMVTVSAEEVWGWFTKEVFDVERTDRADRTDRANRADEPAILQASANAGASAGGAVWTLRTWNGRPVIVREDGAVAVGADGETDGGDNGNANGGATPDDGIRAGDPNVNGGATAAAADAPAAFLAETVTDGLREAVAAARQADAAVVFVGNHPLVNGKETIDRPDITLPASQERLIREVYAANPNTIVVIVGSYPFAVNWADAHVPAILYTSHAGQELGAALADVLFGDYNPAGRLNMTWYRSADQLPDLMDYDVIKGGRTYRYFAGEPLYPFGHGLSYTQFAYANLRLDRTALREGETAKVTVDVTNVGDRDGEEVVQLYVSYGPSRVKRPLRQLAGFRRVPVRKGETVTVSFDLPARELMIWDVTRERWCLETCHCTVSVGRSSADLVLSAPLAVEGERIPPRDLTQVTKAINYDDYEGVRIWRCTEGGSSVAVVGGHGRIAFRTAGFSRPARFCELRAASPQGGTATVRLGSPDGPSVGVCAVPPTGSDQTWHTLTCAVEVPAGVHDVWLVLDGELNLSWFRLF